MKKKSKSDLSLSAGWKSLKSNSSRRSVSGPALRKKINFRLKLGLIAVILLGTGSFLLWNQFGKASSPESGISLSAGSVPVRQIQFSSDGVLTHQWFSRWFGPLRKRSLMDIDLEELHHALVEEEQIDGAQISRIFPDKLIVTITEKHPLLVVRLRDKERGLADWLISADGAIYRGEGYSKSRLSSLPSLRISAGQLKTNSEADGFEKLSGIPRVAPLLELARRDYPDLYRSWRVVSYERPGDSDPGAHILVESKKVGKIRFSPSGFAAQMKRLRYLLTEPRFSQSRFVRSIDLSHDRSVFAKI